MSKIEFNPKAFLKNLTETTSFLYVNPQTGEILHEVVGLKSNDTILALELDPETLQTLKEINQKIAKFTGHRTKILP